MFSPQSIERLQEWLYELEEHYVRLALMIARYEDDHDLAAFNDSHVKLDRLEVDMERAKHAIELAKKHALRRLALKAADEARGQPAPTPEPV